MRGWFVCSTMKFLFALTLVLFGLARCDQEEDFRKIDSIIQEAPCTSIGGICTIAADCPGGHLSEQRGLCPSQRNDGIECCHGLSMKETRCSKNGGVCMPLKNFCNPKLIFDASDCSEDTKCCIMTLFY